MVNGSIYEGSVVGMINEKDMVCEIGLMGVNIKGNEKIIKLMVRGKLFILMEISIYEGEWVNDKPMIIGLIPWVNKCFI